MKKIKTDLRYGEWENMPTRFNANRAWLYRSKHPRMWVRIHPAEANCLGCVLSRADFEKWFGKLPPLPRSP